MIATPHKYILKFKQPSATSRGVLTTKETWFIIITDVDKIGIGECALLRGLSIDDRPDYKEKLLWVCQHINEGLDVLSEELTDFPSIRFGLEMAFKSLQAHPNPYELYPSEFTQGKKGIPINGLVWMGDESFMRQQIDQKIKAGFKCLKLKIGAIDFASELKLLQSIRDSYTSADIELRVDANGAFSPSEALERLKYLADLDLHSIEQPLKAGQWQDMARLCEESPLPIALDEELIGVQNFSIKQDLLQTISPQYIILKPSLIGGYKDSNEWISLANQNNIGWWITSALESNIGLNAIAQWTKTLNNNLPQGLGTGGLFSNNFNCPLHVKNGTLHYLNSKQWDFKLN